MPSSTTYRIICRNRRLTNETTTESGEKSTSAERSRLDPQDVRAQGHSLPDLGAFAIGPSALRTHEQNRMLEGRGLPTCLAPSRRPRCGRLDDR